MTAEQWAEFWAVILPNIISGLAQIAPPIAAVVAAIYWPSVGWPMLAGLGVIALQGQRCDRH
jgi:hypothetical protein